VKTEPATARGRDSVRRVLDAACVLFARQGIRATTLDQVGRLSRTGRGQLYLFFEDKQDLVTEVVRLQVDRVLTGQQPLLGALSSADDVRDWCLLATQQYGADEPIRCPIGSLVLELGEQDDTAREALAAGFARWRDAFAEGFTRVRARGELAPGLSPADAAVALLAAYQGGILLSEAARDLGPLRAALGVAASSLVRNPAPGHNSPLVGSS
jgi:AcrR family transcriptional regulator